MCLSSRGCRPWKLHPLGQLGTSGVLAAPPLSPRPAGSVVGSSGPQRLPPQPRPSSQALLLAAEWVLPCGHRPCDRLASEPSSARLPQVTSSTCEPRLGTALAGLALPCPLPWPCGHFLCDAAPTRPGPATPHVPPCARVARSHPLVYTPVRGSRCALLIRVSLGPGLPRVLSDCPWCE